VLRQPLLDNSTDADAPVAPELAVQPTSPTTQAEAAAEAADADVVTNAAGRAQQQQPEDAHATAAPPPQQQWLAAWSENQALASSGSGGSLGAVLASAPAPFLAAEGGGAAAAALDEPAPLGSWQAEQQQQDSNITSLPSLLGRQASLPTGVQQAPQLSSAVVGVSGPKVDINQSVQAAAQ